jgi:hypothetical protein
MIGLPLDHVNRPYCANKNAASPVTATAGPGSSDAAALFSQPVFSIAVSEEGPPNHPPGPGLKPVQRCE